MINRNKKNKKKIDGEKLFSIIASLAIVAALVAGIVSVVKSSTKKDDKKNYLDLNIAQSEPFSNKQEEPQKMVEKETEKDTEKEIEKETEKVTEKETKKELETEKTSEAKAESGNESRNDSKNQDKTIPVNSPVYSFSEESKLLWPVNGEVILGYNMDKTIYFPTLDVYRCNPAIMISASEDTDVYCAAAGIVSGIYSTTETGSSIIVSVGDGYEITYGQLKDITVELGDNITQGTVIAKVAAPTKYFTKEGSNLYFKITRDGTAVDPMIYLGEE